MYRSRENFGPGELLGGGRGKVILPLLPPPIAPSSYAYVILISIIMTYLPEAKVPVWMEFGVTCFHH